jgi:hypothetical protein
MTTKLLTRTECVICHKPMLAGDHALDAYPYRKAKPVKPLTYIPDPWYPGEFIVKSEPNFCCEQCWETKIDCTAATEKRRKKLDPKTFVPILTVEIKN